MDSGFALSCWDASEARRYRPTRTIASGSKTRGARATLVFDAGARTVLGAPEGSVGQLASWTIGRGPDIAGAKRRGAGCSNSKG